MAARTNIDEGVRKFSTHRSEDAGIHAVAPIARLDNTTPRGHDEHHAATSVINFLFSGVKLVFACVKCGVGENIMLMMFFCFNLCRKGNQFV